MKKLVYRVLLLDDRPDSLIYILDMLRDLPFIAEPIVIANPEEAFAYLRDNEVDILLLDMDFGRDDLNGIKFMGMLSNPPITVACSSYSTYVYDAEEVGIKRFIGKTISFRAFERLMRSMAQKVDHKEEMERRDVAELELLDLMGREIILPIKEIYYAQVSNNIVTVFTEMDEYKFKMSLKKFRSLLPLDSFSRPHCSYLVSLEKVSVVTGRKVFFHGSRSNEQITVSQECNKEFRHALELFRQKRGFRGD